MSQSESRERCAGPGTSRLVVLVNGHEKAIPASCNVAQLLLLLDLSGDRIAVAVNREVVPRSHYPGVALTAGDRVEILEAVGGG